MPIRIEDGSGHWCEFRDEKWRFGDRIAILEAGSDVRALDLILPFVTAWNLTDVSGDAVPFDGGAKSLMSVDDEVATWLIGAWFEARAKRVAIPKVS